MSNGEQPRRSVTAQHAGPTPLVDGGDPRVNDLPVAVLVYDRRRGVINGNRAWTALTGRSLSESVGEGWLGALHVRQRLEAWRLLDTVAARQSAAAARWEIAGPDGASLRVEVRAVGYEAGEQRRCVATLIGIAGAESDPPTASTGSIGEVVAGLRRIAAQLDLLWSSVGHGEGMSMHVGEASHAVHRALIVLNGQSSREA